MNPDTALKAAVQADDVAAAAAALDEGADPNHGANRPMAAASSPGMIALLLARGGLVAGEGAADARGVTPLHRAVVRRELAEPLVRAMLDAGASIDATDANGRTPFHNAAASGNVTVMEILAGAGAPITAAAFALAPLHSAADGGSTAVVEWLLSRGAAPNAIHRDRAAGDRTPLHYAAGRGNVAAARVLLAAGADPWIKDEHHRGDHQGFAPLHEAVSMGHVAMVELLYEQAPEVLDWPGTKLRLPMNELAELHPEVRSLLSKLRAR